MDTKQAPSPKGGNSSADMKAAVKGSEAMMKNDGKCNTGHKPMPK